MTQVYTEVGVIIFCTILCGLIAVLRFFLLRHKTPRKVDWLTHIFFLGSVCCTISIKSFMCYWGMSEVNLRKQNLPEIVITLEMTRPYWIRLLFWFGFLYTFEIWLLKAAFLTMYWGLFTGVKSKRIYVVYITASITAIGFIVVATYYLTYCLPIERNWTSNLVEFQAHATVISASANTMVSAWNIATDLLIFLIPLVVIGSLKLDFMEKLALAGVFMLGLLSVVVSAIRLAIVLKAVRGNGATLDTVRNIEMLSAIEVTAALVAFCLPALRPMFLRLIRRAPGQNSRSYPGGMSSSKSSGANRRKAPNFMATEVNVDEYLKAAGRDAGGVGGGDGEDIEMTTHGERPASRSSSQEHLRRPGTQEGNDRCDSIYMA